MNCYNYIYYRFNGSLTGQDLKRYAKLNVPCSFYNCHVTCNILYTNEVNGGGMAYLLPVSVLKEYKLFETEEEMIKFLLENDFETYLTIF